MTSRAVIDPLTTVQSGNRSLWGLTPAPVVAAALVVLTGGAVAVADGLPEAGILVEVGLPVAKAVRNLAAALTIGLLVTAATLLPGLPGRVGVVSPPQRHVLRLGALTAAVWAAAGLAVLLLSYADLAGLPVTSAEVLLGMPLFAAEFELGRALALSTALTAVTAVTAALASRFTGTGIAAALAVAALLPLAWTGHAAGTANHGTAVDAQAFHLVGVSVWVGGLAALQAVRTRADNFPVLLRRYSALAGWCFGLVAVSGMIAATVRLNAWADLLDTTYGNLIVLKVAALAALGGAGWYHRRLLLHRGGPSGPILARLAAGELVVMSVAVGVAVALSATSPPPPPVDADPNPAEELLGYPMPPPLTLTTIFTAWRVDPLWLALTFLGAFLYLRAVRQLRRRGDRWPWTRTLAFLAGIATFAAATNGSPGVYGQVLFSMHMVQHMTVATAVPVFIALGAPVTLALRTLPRRRDHSRGPREWLLAVVHSWPSRLLSHPVTAAPLFIGSLVVFYYSPVFQLSLSTHLGHVLMMIHFLISGYLFANVICGIDPGPARPPYPFRLLLLIVTFAFHAFFAVSMMTGGDVLAQDWFRQLPRTWGRTLDEEQSLGAALSWALGDYPVAILAIALVYSWIKSDARDARRHDRQAHRDGGAELAAYNAYLAGLAHPATTPDRAGATTPRRAPTAEAGTPEQAQEPG